MGEEFEEEQMLVYVQLNRSAVHLQRTQHFNQLHVLAQSLQARPALCDPMDHSLPGPSVHGMPYLPPGGSFPLNYTLIKNLKTIFFNIYNYR